MSIAARTLVAPPNYTPSPYGLLSVVDLRAGEDMHWQMGVTWEDVCGGAGVTLDACVTSAPVVTGVGLIPAKTATTSRSSWGATPFTVYVEVDCSPVDFYNDRESIMQAALNRFESFQVERTFWTGLAPERNNAGGLANGVLPHLASNAVVSETNLGHTVTLQQSAVVPTGSAVNVVNALGLLEQQIANCLNGQGVIHVPQALMPDMALLVQKQGNRLVTPNGNLVSVGAGYPGTSPAGAAPAAGTVWMYATGPVFAYRSSPNIRLLEGASPLRRDINTVQAIIERTYLLGYGCCLAAQAVNTASFIATSTTTP